MTLPQKRWILKPQQKDLCNKIAQHLNCSPILAQVLLNRNLNSLLDIQYFLTTDLPISRHFPKETLIQCAEIIQLARTENFRILIYGDYDVDGITSTTLMTSILRKIGLHVDYYVPNRFTDGYGLNISILDRIQKGNYQLLITLDCGISNFYEIQQLKKRLNTHVLILDHHIVSKDRPEADGILNPKDLDETHPMWNLCTVGLCYIFCEFLNQHLSLKIPMQNYLDLVALGTIADIVPLIGVNRPLVSKGLKQLSLRKRLGIHYLLEAAKFTNPYVTTQDISFVIAPRLNSAGRLKHALICIDLLLETNPDKARKLASHLNNLNNERREIGMKMKKDAMSFLLKNTSELKSNIIILSSPMWHSGVIGITAAQLVEHYHLPSIVMSIEDTIVKGSARSCGNINIYQLLTECSHFFEKFGGHKNAAGFSMKQENVSDFKKHLQSLAFKTISHHDTQAIIHIDMSLLPQHLTMDIAYELEKLEPHGHENNRPVFYSNQFKAIDFKRVGDGSHIKATLTDLNGNYIFDAIGFGLANKLHFLYKPNIEIAFHLDINVWNQQTKLQMQLLDIK